MKCIFLYDYTGIMAQPWVDAGHECYIIDGQHKAGVSKEGKLTKVGMWLTPDSAKDIIDIVGSDVSFVFGFPECTDLAVSGAAHFAKKRKVDPEFQTKAVDLAKLVEKVANHYDAPWGLENPISVMSTLWRKPDYLFHPWEYGGYLPENDTHPTYPEYIAPRDAYPKKTCIWAGNGFIMPSKKEVECPVGYSTQHKKLGGKSLKTKNIRSATPRGFAKAVYLTNGVN